MNALASVLAWALLALPVERVVVLPFEPLGIEPERAARAELALRRSLREVPRVAMVDDAATRAVFAADPGLRGCAEPHCLAAIAARLQAHSVVTGVVAGLGGFRSVILKRTDRAGKVVTSVSEELPEDDAALPDLVCAVMARAPRCWRGEPGAAQLVAPAPSPPSAATEAAGLPGRRKAALGAGAGALASLGVALGFGLSARSIAGEVERRELDCAGSALVACVESRFSTGRTHAAVSNALWGSGGALAATAAILWIWPESKQPAALAPGPAPIGVSVHARY